MDGETSLAYNHNEHIASGTINPFASMLFIFFFAFLLFNNQ